MSHKFAVWILAILLLITPQISSAQTRIGPRDTKANLDQLLSEINKAPDPADPAKMLRYWFLVERGDQLSDEDLKNLWGLADRQPKRARITADTDLYMTILANQILSLYQIRQREQAQAVRELEFREQTKKAIEDLQKQILELQFQLESRNRERNKTQ